MASGGSCARARRGFYPFYRQPARGRAFLGHIAAPEEEGFGLGALDGDGDGEVAAAELDWAAWQGEEGSSAGWSGARRSRGCHMRRWSSRRWPAALHGGGGAALLRRQVKQRGREVEEDCWTFFQFLKNPGILL